MRVIFCAAMGEIKSVREILEELAAGDDRLRDTFPKWLEELDRKKLPPKKAPGREVPVQIEEQVRPPAQRSRKSSSGRRRSRVS